MIHAAYGKAESAIDFYPSFFFQAPQIRKIIVEVVASTVVFYRKIVGQTRSIVKLTDRFHMENDCGFFREKKFYKRLEFRSELLHCPHGENTSAVTKWQVFIGL